MSKLFSVNRSTESVDIALLITRVAFGSFMLVHGIGKLPMLSQSPVQFMDFMGLGAELTLYLALFSEILCAVLVILGLATRLAVIPLIITMLVAVFMVHGSDPISKQEMALHYLVVFIMIFITGPGKYSVDKLIAAKR